MTAPASIPALIAEGRRLIAAATATDPKTLPLRLHKALSGDLLILDGYEQPLATSDEDGYVGFDEQLSPLAVFAVNHLAALLDVAEAAAAVQHAMQCYRDSGGYHPYRALLDKHDALDAALAALALGPDGEGKGKSNG